MSTTSALPPASQLMNLAELPLALNPLVNGGELEGGAASFAGLLFSLTNPQVAVAEGEPLEGAELPAGGELLPSELVAEQVSPEVDGDLLLDLETEIDSQAAANQVAEAMVEVERPETVEIGLTGTTESAASQEQEIAAAIVTVAGEQRSVEGQALNEVEGESGRRDAAVAAERSLQAELQQSSDSQRRQVGREHDSSRATAEIDKSARAALDSEGAQATMKAGVSEADLASSDLEQTDTDNPSKGESERASLQSSLVEPEPASLQSSLTEPSSRAARPDIAVNSEQGGDPKPDVDVVEQSRTGSDLNATSAQKATTADQAASAGSTAAVASVERPAAAATSETGAQSGRDAALAASRAAGDPSSGSASRDSGDEARQDGKGARSGEQSAARSGEGVKAEASPSESKGFQFDNPFKVLAPATAQTRTESLSSGALPTNYGQIQQTYQGSSNAPVTLGLPERFGTESWGPSVSHRIQWMANQQVGRAEIRLDPPELGSLNVRLTITQDQASLSFTSPHAHVREALEQHLPRLREMLAENGIELQHSSVSDQSEGRSGEDRQQSEGGQNATADTGVAGVENVDAQVRTGSLALVDYYA